MDLNNLDHNEVNIILAALAELPFKVSAMLITKIQRQCMEAAQSQEKGVSHDG